MYTRIALRIMPKPLASLDGDGGDSHGVSGAAEWTDIDGPTASVVNSFRKKVRSHELGVRIHCTSYLHDRRY